MIPESALVQRFGDDLDALVASDRRIGIAVSGGPDSLALLLLAVATRPDGIEAATVDHAFRPGSRQEAEMVGGLCDGLAVPHAILTAEWSAPPETAIQESARAERYRLLSAWATDRGLEAIATAHHLDDQAETLVMRLARGAGVRGLAGMRRKSVVPRSEIPLLRPLLDWRRLELEKVCAHAGVEPAADPSNEDERFERVRVRRALAGAHWLDPPALAASAANLGDANSALDWAARQEWSRGATSDGAEIVYRAGDAPTEIRRRIVSRAVARLATEGQSSPLRGRELDRLLAVLEADGTATIRGVRCSGGSEWRFAEAPRRKA